MFSQFNLKRLFTDSLKRGLTSQTLIPGIQSLNLPNLTLSSPQGIIFSKPIRSQSTFSENPC